MVKNHLKTITAPKSWPINRKESVFVTRAKPGAHKMELSLPLGLCLRNILNKAQTRKEAKNILNNQELFVNNKRRKDVRKTVGIMDVIAIPKIDEYYRLLINQKGKLFVLKIDKSEAQITLAKIMNKTNIAKGKTQINLSNGYNVVVEKDNYKTKDTIIFDLLKKQIREILPFEKGSTILIVEGKSIGKIAKIVDFKGNQIIFEYEKKQYETTKNYAFVIGKDKPIIKV